jgi:uridylate kinase
MKETVVLSLGGSLVNPGKIDSGFLKKFRKIILDLLPKKNFVIVVGGGSVCRAYNRTADSIVKKVSREEKDRMGVYATMVNAQLVKIVFGGKAAGIFQDPTNDPGAGRPIMVASGWKPGFSTDFDSVLWAKTMGAKAVINMTDVDYIYTADPDFDKKAKPIKRMTWDGYKQVTGGKWKPGMNVPFDPVASREAQRLKLKVTILNGKRLANLKACLEGEEFKGSIIG